MSIFPYLLEEQSGSSARMIKLSQASILDITDLT